WNRMGAPIWRESGGTALSDLHAGGPIGGAPSDPVGGLALPEVRVPEAPTAPTQTGSSNTVLPALDPSALEAPKGLERDSYIGRTGASAAEGPLPQFLRGEIEAHVSLADLIQSRLVFCFPENEKLLGYWNHVEDRLFKIRNCRDISGTRRRL